MGLPALRRQRCWGLRGGALTPHPGWPSTEGVWDGGLPALKPDSLAQGTGELVQQMVKKVPTGFSGCQRKTLLLGEGRGQICDDTQRTLKLTGSPCAFLLHTWREGQAKSACGQQGPAPQHTW